MQRITNIVLLDYCLMFILSLCSLLGPWPWDSGRVRHGIITINLRVAWRIAKLFKD